MGIFGLLNYEDYIFRTVANSSYAKKTLTVFLIYLVTALTRFHLSVILCFIFATDNILNFIIPIVINVSLSLLSTTIYNYVSTHKSFFEQVIDYLITNYSIENFKIWKRCVLLIFFFYILMALIFITVDNTFVFITTIQAAIGFIICDIFDNFPLFGNFIKKQWNKPKVYKLIRDFSIVPDYPIDPHQYSQPSHNDFFSKRDERDERDEERKKIYPVSPKPVSPPVSPKPGTPPVSRKPLSPPVSPKPGTPPNLD